MLSSLLKEHNVKTQGLRDEQEKKRKEALTAATNLTSAMVDHLNVGVAQAYLNEKKLDSEMKLLTTNSTNFAKQTQQWLGLIDNFNTALKELGHVQSWAKAIESDVKIITNCLEHAYKASQPQLQSQESQSGGGGGGGSISSQSSGTSIPNVPTTTTSN